MADKNEIRYTINVDTESGTASIRNLKGQLMANKVPLQQLRAEFGNFAKTVNSTDFDKFNKGLRAAGGAAAQMRNASGGATSSVLELGRVIQDAPYGLRGMANNITQLASQMAFATKSAGGFGKALKEMGKAMTGPLGVVFLISLVVSAMEMLQGSIGKTEKDLEKLTDASITNAVSELTTLKDIIVDTSISLERKQEAIRKATEEYADLNISIDGTTESTIQALKALDLLIDKYSDVAYANAITELQVEAMKELANANRTSEGSFKDLFSSFEAFAYGMQAFKWGGDGFDIAKQVKVANIYGELNEIEKLFKQKTKADPNLTYAELIFGREKTRGGRRGGRSRVDRIFKEQFLILDKFILEQGRNLEKSKERNVLNLLKIDQRYAREDLELTYTTFVDKQKLRFRQYVETEAERKKLTVEQFKQTEQYAKEEAKLNKSLSDAEIEYNTAAYEQKLAQEAAYQRKRLEIVEKFNDIMLKTSLKSAQLEAKAQLGLYDGSRAGTLGNPQSKVGADGIESQTAIQENLMAIEQKNFEDSLAIKLENLQREGMLLSEAEAIIAEDRFQFQTNMVTRELELERQKVQAKKNINLEYVSWVEGLSNIFKGVAGENKALATAALVLEKGAAVAKVIINTTAANREILATSGKEAAKLSLTGKANVALGAGMAITNPVQGAALIKAGTAQIAAGATTRAEAKTRIAKNKAGAAISIASILATTLQSKGVGTGGSSDGGGGGRGGRTFDFNLVGSTGENQLAQGIAGQFSNTPIQAYVVASQVTSQQELDNQIQGTATLGR